MYLARRLAFREHTEHEFDSASFQNEMLIVPVRFLKTTALQLKIHDQREIEVFC